MIIVLVRHGQTEYNKKFLVQGRSDISLNDNGRNDAFQTAKVLKNSNLEFDLIYSSPLKRAYETATIIKDELNLGLDINQDEHFFERNFGPYEAMPVKDAFPITKEYGDYENDQAIIKRVNQGIDNLYLKYPNQKILITCHSHTIKAILIKMDPITYNFKSYIKNGAIFILEYDGNNYKILNILNNH